MSTKKKSTEETLTIAPPNMQTATFTLVGTAPFLQHKFSKKARDAMRRNMAAGDKAKNKKKKEPRDFDEDYKQSMYVTHDGKNGISAPSFRNAMISACRVAGFQMTKAKLSVFVLADGFDSDDGTPLVFFTKGKPQHHESMVRIQQTTNIAVRAMWREGWEVDLRVRWDGDQFTLDDVTNLLMRAGMQVGVGEGRPDSKQSAGMGLGTFEVKEIKSAA